MTLERHEHRRSLLLLGYVAVLLLACSSKKSWQTQPSQPAAAVEQTSSVESLRQQATAARGDASAAVAYADAVAVHLDAGGAANAEADPGLALELLDVAAQQEPLRGAEIDYARANVEFGLRDYDAAVATYETNARKRGHAPSATKVVRYYAAAGEREPLTAFCNEAFPLIRGGDEKHLFVAECAAGMGYASPAEWNLMSGPALDEYERWRATRAQAQRDKEAEKVAAARAAQEQAAAADQADRDKKNCVLRCAEKEALCKSNCYDDVCRKDCSDAEWACRRQCS